MLSIREAFENLRLRGQKGFIPFITAGDPDLETTLAIMRALAEIGSTVIELGVPFTDPMADGPVIQASSKRALEGVKTVTVADVLYLVSEFRQFSDIPVVVFGYMNPFEAYGIRKLASDGNDAGVGGILITDVVDREFRNLSEIFRAKEINMISLVAPTTSDLRLQRIVSEANGFVYAVSTRGVTGSGTVLEEAEQLVNRIKAATEIPVAVGFGLSTRKDLEEVWRYADAAVVGSAIVDVIGSGPPSANVVTEVREFLKTLLGRET